MPFSPAFPSSGDSWLRPSGARTDEPRWGHVDGIQIGIPPIPGPRGLLRVFTPYLDHPPDRVVNFIAVEPIRVGAHERGFSELEPSTLDPGARGKRFWSAEDADAAEQRADDDSPARGTIAVIDGAETLTVWIGVERFDNGADVRVRVRFFADRPHEVEVAGFANTASAPLSHLILTATMGNWARLRLLHLEERTVTAAELWPEFSGTAFAEHERFPLAELSRDGDAVVVSATGDEDEPWSVEYSPDTVAHWRFLGLRAAQSWRVDDPHPELEIVVNARWAYWTSASPIPGGPAYENFEIIEPFRQGAAFRFSVEPV